MLVGSRDKQSIKSHSESFSQKSYYCIAHLRLCITLVKLSFRLSFQSHFVSILHPTTVCQYSGDLLSAPMQCNANVSRLSQTDQIMGSVRDSRKILSLIARNLDNE